MSTFTALRDYMSGAGVKRRSGIAAAMGGRLTSSWATQPKPLDTDIRNGLTKTVARSREIAINNDYVKHYLRTLKSNVVGSTGILFRPQSKDPDGTLDKLANNELRAHFAEWGEAGGPDVTGVHSWHGLQNLGLETCATDGELLVRVFRNWKHNRYRMAVEFIDAQALDVHLNKDLGNDRAIKMGIELDKHGRRVAYYIRSRSKHDELYGAYGTQHLRIPANEIIHGFLPEAVIQTRGYPWLAVAMFRAKMLAGYEEAELVAARVASAKMGWFVPDPEQEAAEWDGDEDPDGAALMEAEPGAIDRVPKGYKFDDWDPSHPNNAYPDFTKQMLRGMGAGLGVSYFTFANDPSGVNYSSGRLAHLEEREIWKGLQRWYTDVFIRRVYREWLRTALLTGEITVAGKPLRPSNFNKYAMAKFQGRRWQWMDPKKDMEGEGMMLDRLLKSPQDVITERGGDVMEVLDDWQDWEKELESRNLEVTLTQQAPAPELPEKEDGAE